MPGCIMHILVPWSVNSEFWVKNGINQRSAYCMTTEHVDCKAYTVHVTLLSGDHSAMQSVCQSDCLPVFLGACSYVSMPVS
jgi:hypothetical protein